MRNLFQLRPGETLRDVEVVISIFDDAGFRARLIYRDHSVSEEYVNSEDEEAQ